VKETEAARSGFLANPPLAIIALLIGTRILIAGLDLRHTGDLSDDTDIRRYTEIANTPGRPYQDFSVEYMPVEVLTIRTLVGASPAVTFHRVVGLSLVSDLLVFGAMWFGWGRRSAALYVALSLPLLTFLYFRIDLLSVALSVWAFALVRRGRDAPGGALLALAVLTKLWPLVLVPALIVERRGKALLWAAATGMGGLAIWLAYGGVDALRQVTTFRGATGWEVESTIGDLVWILTGGPIRLEQGSTRVGTVPEWARVALVLVLLGTVGAIWRRAAASRASTSGRALGPPVLGEPALGALGALLALSPLFSLQYASWLAPWGALAVTKSSDARLGRAAFAAIALTGVLSIELSSLAGSPATWEGPLAQMVIIVRDGLCVALPLFYLSRTLAPGRPRTGEQGLEKR
jgi:hypothetical protein